MIIRCSFILCSLILVNAVVIGQVRDTCEESIEFVDQIIREKTVEIVKPASPYDSLLATFPEKDRYLFERVINLKEGIMTDSLFNKVPTPILEKSSIVKLTLSIKSDEILSSNLYKISSLKKLKSLIISNDGIKKLPKELSNLKTLEELIISSYTKEFTFDTNLKNLTALQTVGFFIPYLTEVPQALTEVSTLKKLFLRIGDKNDTLSINFKNYINLEYLEIRSECKNLKVESLPSKIKKIDLTLGEVKVLPENIYKLKTLEKLVIYASKFEYLSSSIKNLISLRELEIYTNRSLQIPKEISKLPNLDLLMLESSDLTFNSDIICPQVKKFEYGRGVIKNLEQFPNLEALLVAAGGDNSIPDLKKLKKLKYIKINARDITTLPDYIFTELKSLEEIDLTDANSSLQKQGAALKEKYPHIKIRYEKYKDRNPSPPFKY